jgi:hypothetical protein
MDLANAFYIMDQNRPFTDDSYDPSAHQPQFQQNTAQMSEQYNLYKLQPKPYNIEGFISPYASNNWSTSSGILSYVEDSSRFPALEPRFDPNRIFSSDDKALSTLAADHNRITKMMEKRLMESLTERGKVGLTEEDIEAMQAITSARSTIASIERERVNIKKNIADLRLKQAQQNQQAGGNGQDAVSNGSGFDEAKSVMDRIFELSGIPTPPSQFVPSNTGGLDAAATALDEIVPTVSASTQFEVLNPTTYVVVNGPDDPGHFETYDENGNLIDGYPNPTTPIDLSERDTGYAISLGNKYPIKTQ